MVRMRKGTAGGRSPGSGFAADATAHRMRAPGGRGARLGTPFGDPDQPRLDKLEAVEEPPHVGQRPNVQLRRSLAVDPDRLLAFPGRVLLHGAVRDGQVAARRHVVAVPGDDL